jgi:UDPglucose 6-dehydrogenase
MHVTIFGTGYVGLVTGACLAGSGNHVLCVDVDADKVAALDAGKIPIYESGLEALVNEGRTSGRLAFTTDAAAGVSHGLFQFICVGTPPDENGSADLQHVRSVARSIGQHLSEYRIIVDKSTVPVGTADQVKAEITAVLNQRGVAVQFDVASNPEFLKEGAAIEDFMKPDRIIVGTDDPRTAALLRTLYEPFNRSRDRVLVMDVRSAELTKYAANAMLATKISFMNELANLAERLGADIEQVRLGIGSDPRIGYHFIYPGCGYGGSCFPKDVKALAAAAESVGYEPALLSAVETVNRRQKQVLLAKLSRHYKDGLRGKTFAVWGLSFKPNTDDMREASSRDLVEGLWAEGAVVRAYDPVAMTEARRLYGNRDDFVLCARAQEALSGADALVVVTEWREFRSPDFDQIKLSLRQPVIFDGRNIYDPDLMQRLGITYYGIGRGASVALS